MAHDDIARFYKHSASKRDIGLKHADDKDTIGPNIQQLFDFLRHEGMAETAHMYVREGDPGFLFVAHRKLFTFSHPRSDNLAQVYELALSYQGGFSQYLSALLQGEYRTDIFRHFREMGFVQKHSFLEEQDKVAGAAGINGLWIDDFVSFEQMMPK